VWRRYDAGRRTLVRLLPRLTELNLFDNSEEADPAEGATPMPKEILHLLGGRIVAMSDPRETPEWAKPIVAAALRLSP
jgi:hypothetical protein